MPRISTQAFSLAAIVVGMVMLAYASVPLYRIFCQVTGFGGTTARGERVIAGVSERAITVRFNADTAPGLPWDFRTPEASMRVQLGASNLAAFTAENTSETPILGMATYNVTPHAMGRYFTKIQCFCFEQQRLNPHERVNMPVSFIIDPAMLDDPETRNLQEVTLSYTFFEQKTR